MTHSTTPGETPVHTTVERGVLARITPKEQMPASARDAIKRLEGALVDLDAQLQLGGSVAKGTNLAGDHDVDVFVRFATENAPENLSDALAAVLQRVFPDVERVHGSRDYFHVALPDGTLEIIPVLAVETWEEAANVTDMSPLHVAYVHSHVQKRPWLAGEIRLTKQFMKSAKVYGAESYIGGFSGHVVDLLIICYGGFHALLSAAVDEWSRKVVLDPENHLTDPLAQLNASKTLAPLVIVDPVQADRNSAAALTRVCLERFREHAAAYLEAADLESERFFEIEPLSERAFAAENSGARIVRVELTPLAGKRDVVGAKCAKVHEHLLRALGEHGFGPNASAWEFTPAHALLLYAVSPEDLPAQMDVVGPPVHMTDAVGKFSSVHESIFTHDGRVHALEDRPYRDALSLLQDRVKDAYVRERVKSARVSDAQERR